MQLIRIKLTNSEGKSEGCEKAPVKVLKALREIKSKENGEVIEFDKLNLEEIHVDLENLEEANNLIYKNSEEVFYKNEKVFFVGGDGCISYSIVKAFDKVEENPLLIVFDAHADCEEDERFATNRNWLRKLIEGGFNPRNVILISARNLLEEEVEFLKSHGILWIKMDVIQEDVENICDLVMERAQTASGFYISVDMDCVSPGFAPGVSCLDAGGLSDRDLIYFIKRLKLLDNFRGGDIVEINPDKDVNEMTVKLGARLLGEMI